ncbi:hypothetical protein RRG08_008945 [Elysia crispata]|uniref:Uncharacterized protein n=1 Tax=Elysia crispata TaxID=231223 RepID=A0AAE1DHA9_9GAST|nr:hypothetical protein RRG08_008945 [Elysia crispata]
MFGTHDSNQNYNDGELPITQPPEPQRGEGLMSSFYDQLSLVGTFKKTTKIIIYNVNPPTYTTLLLLAEIGQVLRAASVSRRQARSQRDSRAMKLILSSPRRSRDVGQLARDGGGADMAAGDLAGQNRKIRYWKLSRSCLNLNL